MRATWEGAGGNALCLLIQHSEFAHWTRSKDIALLYGAFDTSGLLWRLLHGLLVRADGTGGARHPVVGANAKAKRDPFSRYSPVLGCFRFQREAFANAKS